MSNHLSKEKLERLAKNELEGAEYFDALAHIESCAECRLRMPSISKEAVLKVFDGPEGLIEENRPAFAPAWGWGLAFSAAAAIIVLGLFWFSPGETKTDDIAKNPDKIEKPSPLNNTNSETPLPEKTFEDEPDPEPTAPPGTETAKSDSANIKAKPLQKKNASNEAKSDIPKAESKSDAPSKSGESISPEIAGLKRFLVKVPAALVELRPFSGAVRGGSAAKGDFLSPNGEVVREVNPELRWAAEKDADRYKVSLHTKQYQEVVSATTNGTEFKTSRPLERGKSYIWKVAPLDSEGRPASPSRKDTSAIFKVASKKVVARLEKLERSGADDWKVAEFLLNEGMLGEAEAKLQALRRKYPKNKLAGKLLLRIKKLRGAK